MARPPGSSSSFLAVGSYWQIILSLSMHRLASIHQVGLNQCLINPFIHSQIVFIIFRRRWRRRWGYREQQQFPNRPQFGTVERDFRRAPPRFGPETTPPGDEFNSKSGRPHRLDRGPIGATPTTPTAAADNFKSILLFLSAASSLIYC